ncbi:MAG: AAA family ATPase [Gammaproteobacteria bacterium]|nr:AAA family ATPase [Gammaproteobacteria bacterium]
MNLDRIRVRNYRALADVDIGLNPVNVIFGPNGAGKSTLLDTIYFFRDCAIRGVELASSNRHHGIGLLWDGADEGSGIEIELTAGSVTYELAFSLAPGKLDPYPGEKLTSANRDAALISRHTGSDKATLYNVQVDQAVPIELREPEKTSLGLFLDFNRGDSEAGGLDHLLHFVRMYHSRSFRLVALKRHGSESSHQTRLWDLGDNAWSVLRNIKDARELDSRYDTIMRYMSEAFPFFDGIVLEATGPNTVYASLREKHRRKTVLASGASDGVLQLLLILIALFSEGEREAVLLLDEPEIALHPWAIAVLAQAVQHAASEWRKQVLIATHSPVLISQFEPGDILVARMEEGRAHFDRLSEIEGIGDLLEQYATGALYMSQEIAGQGPGAAGDAQQ